MLPGCVALALTLAAAAPALSCEAGSPPEGARDATGFGCTIAYAGTVVNGTRWPSSLDVAQQRGLVTGDQRHRTAGRDRRARHSCDRYGAVSSGTLGNPSVVDDLRRLLDVETAAQEPRQTSARIRPPLKSSGARTRADWLLLPWIAAARSTPASSSCSARRLALCLVTP